MESLTGSSACINFKCLFISLSVLEMVVSVEAICASAWPIPSWLSRTASVIKHGEVEWDLGTCGCAGASVHRPSLDTAFTAWVISFHDPNPNHASVLFTALYPQIGRAHV